MSHPLISWDATTSEWLTARQAGLGASEVAAALGLPGAYQTPWQVWARKTGRLNLHSDPSEPMMLGNALEPWLVEQAANLIIGCRYVHQPADRLYQSDEHPWMLASPDAVAVYHPFENRVVECKVAGIHEPWSAEDWETDLVPLRYEVQVTWQMETLGLRTEGYVVGLVAGFGLRCWTVPYNTGTAAELVAQAGEWWQRHIVEDREPALMPADDTVMTDAYRDVTDGEVEIPEELFREYLAARTVASAADKRMRLARAAMKRALAGRLKGKADGRLVASYKPDTNGIRRLWVAGDGEA